MPISQCVALARLWYADRLTPEWRPKTIEVMENIFGQVGQQGEFWRVRV